MGRMPTCSKRTPKSCVGDFELAVGLAYDSTSALGCHYTAMVCVCVCVTVLSASKNVLGSCSMRLPDIASSVRRSHFDCPHLNLQVR